MVAGLLNLALPEVGLKAAGGDPASASNPLGQLVAASCLQAALWSCDTESELSVQLLAVHRPWACVHL